MVRLNSFEEEQIRLRVRWNYFSKQCRDSPEEFHRSAVEDLIYGVYYNPECLSDE